MGISTRKAPFYVYVIGRAGWRQPHETIESALNEAERLSAVMERKKDVIVLATVRAFEKIEDIEIEEKPVAPIITVKKSRKLAIC